MGLFSEMMDEAGDIKSEVARLRAALSEISGPDPKADLDEPDEDWQVVRKLRAIARAALALRQGERA